MRSTDCFGAPEVPQTANLIASTSVDFPLPRGPIMQVRPRGMLMFKPGRNPPLISIFSTNHIRPGFTAYETRAVWLSAHRRLAGCCLGTELGALRYCTPRGTRAVLYLMC